MDGELNLFETAAGPGDGAWTVRTVTTRARQLVESGFRRVWVKGEISNFKAYRSGHWYFSLRDAEAQVRCVMWRDDNRRVDGRPEEGIEVFVECRPTVWEERGEFRLTVHRLLATSAGGIWELKLQRARAALERDGLLDPARKRPLPAYPSRIVVVTSPDGAAFRDIVSVLRRRWPAVQLCLVPAVVQGEGAEAQLCAGLDRAGRVEGVDLVIVGRGGGSREDLWAFNSERVARAVAAVPVPVISAVGHETDVSLTDLVADFRAPTPSAAAEAAVPHRERVAEALEGVARHLANSLAARTRFARERLDRTSDRLTATMQGLIEGHRGRLSLLAGQLQALSPLAVLERGFAVARDDAGAVLRSVAAFEVGVPFRLTVRDGTVAARTEGVEGTDGGEAP